MDTITVATAQQAFFLRNLNDLSETVVREAQEASRKMLDVATQVGEGQGAVIDFSQSHVDRFTEALAKREALLTLARSMNIETDALMAAATGSGAWFQTEEARQ